ncbi:MAG: ABC transporter ATP-binding protein [Pseudomonadota bacterium]
MGSTEPDRLHAKDAMAENGLRVFRRIITENFRERPGTYGLAIVCLFVVGASSGLLAWMVKDIVNEVLLATDTGLIFWVAGGFVAAYIARGLAGFLAKISLGRIGNSIVATYQEKVYNHLLTLGLDYFAKSRSGYLVGEINENINSMRQMIVAVLSGITRETVTIIGLFAVMIALEPQLTGIAVLVVIVGGLATRNLIKRIKKQTVALTGAVARVASRFQETVSSMDIVKAFTLETDFSKNASEEIRRAEKASNAALRTDAATGPVIEVLAGLSVGGLLIYVGLRAAGGDADPGSFFAFLTALIMLYDPVKRLLALRVGFERVVTNARMIEGILRTPPRQSDKPDARQLKARSGRVDFTGVSFGYDAALPVVSDVSFVAEPAKITALVGASGSGKTTLLSLLLRYYDADAGTIMIDGQNIADVTSDSLRSAIAYVSQSPILFEGTIGQNIAFGKTTATQEQIERAARAAYAHDFIVALPMGYDTPLGERGTNLSGGQRQRISIARAILRDAPILLLDEATSALDNESEAKVQAAIDDLAGTRTTIVIAHRLSTIRSADMIYVMANGHIVESGKHAQLMKAGGAYAQFQAGHLEMAAANETGDEQAQELAEDLRA